MRAGVVLDPWAQGGRSLDEATLAGLGDRPHRADAPTHKGLDDRSGSYQVVSFALDLAAAAFGADMALFSTNGSTLVQIAVVATTHPGARNVHKSVVSGLILSGAEPVFAMLIASMDAPRRALALQGEELLGRALSLSRRAAEDRANAGDPQSGARVPGPARVRGAR